jgi:hypothetical protein
MMSSNGNEGISEEKEGYQRGIRERRVGRLSVGNEGPVFDGNEGTDKYQGYRYHKGMRKQVTRTVIVWIQKYNDGMDMEEIVRGRRLRKFTDIEIRAKMGRRDAKQNK